MGGVVSNVIEGGRPDIINYSDLLSAGSAGMLWVALERAQVCNSPLDAEEATPRAALGPGMGCG